MSTVSMRRQKKNMYTFQKGLCCYCEKPFPIESLTFEHLEPKCKGGTNRKGNLSLACAPCNNERPSDIDWCTWKSIRLGEFFSDLPSLASLQYQLIPVRLK